MNRAQTGLSAKLKSGGQIVVDLLVSNGLSRVFSVPGESFLPVLDALHDKPGIELVVCRQEGGAAMMAEAYAKASGNPAACFVTRGPGAANAVSGVHVAAQGSTPLLLFVGQVPRGYRDREAWQEVDLRSMFAPLAKWVAEVDDVARLAEYVGRAFHVATSGRPGPVVLVLPEDVLYDEAPVPDVRPSQATHAYPQPRDLEKLQSYLGEAQRPLALVGGGGWGESIQRGMQEFALNHWLPVVCTFRQQDYIDNTHPNYAGHAGLGMNPAVAQRISAADLLLVIGDRLNDTATRGYTLVDIPRPRQRLVHVHPDPNEPGRVYQPDLAICAGSRALVESLATLPVIQPPSTARQQWVEDAHNDYLAWSEPGESTRGRELADIVAWLARELPPDAVITNGAGNYSLWLHRFYRYRNYGAQLAPTSGSMGYGLPAAIAAKLAHPERPVVCFAGDGCLLMTSQELATVAHYGLKLVIVVVNNRLYGSIRMHQERHYPGRISGTDLTNPDFTVFARSFGLESHRVADAGAFRKAFGQARHSDRATLIEVTLEPDTLVP